MSNRLTRWLDTSRTQQPQDRHTKQTTNKHELPIRITEAARLAPIKSCQFDCFLVSLLSLSLFLFIFPPSILPLPLAFTSQLGWISCQAEPSRAPSQLIVSICSCSCNRARPNLRSSTLARIHPLDGFLLVSPADSPTPSDATAAAAANRLETPTRFLAQFESLAKSTFVGRLNCFVCDPSPDLDCSRFDWVCESNLFHANATFAICH